MTGGVVQPPGWYPDPAGVPNRLRFWTGQAWHETTTFDPATPFPSPAGRPLGSQGLGGQPGGATPTGSTPTGSKSRLWWVIGGAVALGLALSLVLFLILGPLHRPKIEVDPERPPTSDGPPSGSSPDASAAPSTGGSPVELNCAGGNQVVTTHEKGRPLSTAGISITYPDNWGVRYDKSLWPFLDDHAAWGRWNTKEKWAGGIAVGGLPKASGFANPKQAAEEQVMQCLTTYGGYNDKQEYPVEPQRDTSTAVKVDGLDGWGTTWRIKGATGSRYPDEIISIVVLDSGQPNDLAVAVAFGPTKAPQLGDELRHTLDTIKKA